MPQLYVIPGVFHSELWNLCLSGMNDDDYAVTSWLFPFFGMCW